jgi:hypothetical protein
VTHESLELWVSLTLLFFVVISCSSILILRYFYLFLVLECIIVSKTLPFLNFNFSPLKDFILPSYVEAQAQAFVASVSLPRVRNPILYDCIIRMFVDDEAREWNSLSLCWAQGWTILAWAFVLSLGWVESFYKKNSHFDYCVIQFLHDIFAFLFLFSSLPFLCEFFTFLHMFFTKNIFHFCIFH